MPVTAKAICTGACSNTPFAIATATSSLTAPTLASSDSGTPISSVFAVFE
jgi:hypothetical protein